MHLQVGQGGRPEGARSVPVHSLACWRSHSLTHTFSLRLTVPSISLSLLSLHSIDPSSGQSHIPVPTGGTTGKSPASPQSANIFTRRQPVFSAEDYIYVPEAECRPEVRKSAQMDWVWEEQGWPSKSKASGPVDALSANNSPSARRGEQTR